MRLKFSCLDIILFSAFAYAISDSVKNWSQYKSCSLPLHLYIIISVIILLIFRLMHFLGQVISGETSEAQDAANQIQANHHGMQVNFAWDMLRRLRLISVLQMTLVGPFFAVWTIYGSVIFIRINSGAIECEGPH